MKVSRRVLIFSCRPCCFSGFKREERNYRQRCSSYFHPIVVQPNTISLPIVNRDNCRKKEIDIVLSMFFFPPFENHGAHIHLRERNQIPQSSCHGLCRNVYKGWATINRPCKTPRYTTRPNTRQDLDLFSWPRKRLVPAFKLLPEMAQSNYFTNYCLPFPSSRTRKFFTKFRKLYPNLFQRSILNAKILKLYRDYSS